MIQHSHISTKDLQWKMKKKKHQNSEKQIISKVIAE